MTIPLERRPTLEEILQILRDEMPDLSSRYKVRSLGIFGSYARGEADEVSDIDLLVDLEDESLSLMEFIALENHLSDLLGAKVDLVERSALKPAIGRRILEEVKAI
ncbi:nucleotidyltransferase family protein [Candidatus Methanocrinis natronophilus]|uniref:protein adenylyltransferase n=1 Tax=Candidatus Methanocrinis natronophilus TaxID=3033396 RepID=A0ABT5X5N7_9EURY|nr:nucleotidyltransferase family protein [Candidatus Methanocrinis natronophilus]MDF0590011.1 nucleotidyltransferase family protein [Candidatus Methanocrinis natronophilus]